MVHAGLREGAEDAFAVGLATQGAVIGRSTLTQRIHGVLGAAPLCCSVCTSGARQHSGMQDMTIGAAPPQFPLSLWAPAREEEDLGDQVVRSSLWNMVGLAWGRNELTEG